jgi:ketosteroid isomerase-like protein
VTAFEQAVDRQFEALKAIVRGDAGPAKAMYSRAEDATLANPWGPVVRGPGATSEMLDFVASVFRDGACEGVERLAAYIDENVATIIENEHWRAKVRGADEQSPFSLRVSTTFRREDGEWKVVLRHADPITAPSEQGVLDRGD